MGTDFKGADLSGIYGAGNAGTKGVNIVKKGSNLDLDMTDFVTLMITELTNQGIDNTVDTSDMLNQMVQMQMVTALANMTDASVMSYAASLVNQKVTVGQYDSEGNLQEYVGTVIGTGTMNGNQVIFLDDGKYYQLSEIMAVGVLPKKPEEPEEPDGSEDNNNSGGSGAVDGSGGTGGSGSTEETENTDRTEGEETESDAEIPAGQTMAGPPPAVSGVEDEYHGESGAPTE